MEGIKLLLLALCVLGINSKSISKRSLPKSVPLTIEEINNGEDDIRLTEEQKNSAARGVTVASRRWIASGSTSFQIPFVIDTTTGFSSDEIATLRSHITDFTEYINCANSKWVEYSASASNLPYYVRIIRGSGCWSYVGKINFAQGYQDLSIGQGCFSKSTVHHEMLHAMGFFHEQSRPDRNTYINVHLDAIQDSRESNYNINGYNDNTIYDYHSNMHYGDYFFATQQCSAVAVDTSLGYPNGYKVVCPDGPTMTVIEEKYQAYLDTNYGRDLGTFPHFYDQKFGFRDSVNTLSKLDHYDLNDFYGCPLPSLPQPSGDPIYSEDFNSYPVSNEISYENKWLIEGDCANDPSADCSKLSNQCSSTTAVKKRCKEKCGVSCKRRCNPGICDAINFGGGVAATCGKTLGQVAREQCPFSCGQCSAGINNYITQKLGTNGVFNINGIVYQSSAASQSFCFGFDYKTAATDIRITVRGSVGTNVANGRKDLTASATAFSSEKIEVNIPTISGTDSYNFRFSVSRLSSSVDPLSVDEIKITAGNC